MCDLRESLGDLQYEEDVRTLAKMAARLAGRDPDQLVCIKFADSVVFDDLLWRYPDFLNRAKIALALLNGT